MAERKQAIVLWGYYLAAKGMQSICREEAKEVVRVIEASFDAIEKKAVAVALQKKLEIKDELTKELATKADIAWLQWIASSPFAGSIVLD